MYLLTHRSFLYVISIPKAPKGAVRSIAITETANTIFPQESPIANGKPPIAACTVAFGIQILYAAALALVAVFSNTTV